MAKKIRVTTVVVREEMDDARPSQEDRRIQDAINTLVASGDSVAVKTNEFDHADRAHIAANHLENALVKAYNELPALAAQQRA